MCNWFWIVLDVKLKDEHHIVYHCSVVDKGSALGGAPHVPADLRSDGHTWRSGLRPFVGGGHFFGPAACC
jgi:hypothetical protein